MISSRSWRPHWYHRERLLRWRHAGSWPSRNQAILERSVLCFDKVFNNVPSNELVETLIAVVTTGARAAAGLWNLATRLGRAPLPLYRAADELAEQLRQEWGSSVRAGVRANGRGNGRSGFRVGVLRYSGNDADQRPAAAPRRGSSMPLPFLDDARQREILRTVGPVYQFRNVRLQNRLPRAENTPQRAPVSPGCATPRG